MPIIKLESIKAYGDDVFPNEIWSLYIEDNKYIVVEYVKDADCKSKQPITNSTGSD